MNLINEYLELEKTVKAAMERMAIIEQDPLFAREREFEVKLRALMGENHKSLRDIINILDPESSRPAAFKNAETKARKARAVLTYVNPHDGSVVETKGGNHKTLRAWSAQYGKDVVKGWAKTN